MPTSNPLLSGMGSYIQMGTLKATPVFIRFLFNSGVDYLFITKL